MAIVLISGITQSGKNALARKLQQKGFDRIPTITSEKNKAKNPAYLYWPQGQMDEMLNKGKFLDYTQYAGGTYGLTNLLMLNALTSNKDAVLVMTPDGIAKVRKYLEANSIQHVAVFLSIPTATAIERLTDKMNNNSLSTEEFISKMTSLAQDETKWTQQAYNGRTFDIVYEIGEKHDLSMVADSIQTHINILNSQTHRSLNKQPKRS